MFYVTSKSKKYTASEQSNDNVPNTYRLLLSVSEKCQTWNRLDTWKETGCITRFTIGWHYKLSTITWSHQ